MKGKKRLIALLLSFLMVLSQMSVATFALDTVADENSDQTVEEQAVEETQPEADVKTAALETEPAATEPAAEETATEPEAAQSAATEPAKAEPAKAEEKKAEPDKAEAKEEAFDQSQTVDGVKVNVSAAKGVFPAGSKLSVSKVAVPGAVDTSDAEAAYAFDISILANGKKIQPDGKATVSFTTAEIADYDTAVYHMDGGAQKMSVSESGETATVKTTGFSTYVVLVLNPTINEKEAKKITLELSVGDTISLDDILTKMGVSTKYADIDEPRLVTSFTGVSQDTVLQLLVDGQVPTGTVSGKYTCDKLSFKATEVGEGSKSLRLRINSTDTSTSIYSQTRITFNYKITEGSKVTFDPKGGKWKDGSTDAIEVPVADGDTVEAPGTPELSGFAFDGWFKDGEDTPFDFDTPINDFTELEARYHEHVWIFDEDQTTSDCAVYKCEVCEAALEASIAFDDEDGIVHYDGKAHGATLTVKLNDEVIGTDENLPDSSILPKFTYYWKTPTNRIMYATVNKAGNLKDPTSDKPVDVNNYAVVTRIRVTGCGPVMIRDDLTILQATPIAAEGLVYKDGNALVTDDGLLPEVTTAVVRYLRPGTKDEYVSKDELLNDGSLSAGTHEIPYIILTSDAGDADVIGEGEVEVTIEKAIPEVTPPVGKTLTYNGQAQELVTAGATSGGTMVYALGKDGKTPPDKDETLWSESVPKGTEVGIYYIWYGVVGDENYEGVAPRCVTSEIVPRQFTISYDLNGGKLDGQTGVVTMKVEEGTVITLPSPTRDGYTFDYWEGSKYNAGDKYTVTGDHTFKAVWKTSGSGKKGNGVNTGDTNDIAGLLVLMIASVGALGALGYRRRKEDQ